MAPLLGLLGTVTGLIETFGSLGTSSTSAASEGIAGGIVEALYATQMGLAIAVPGLLVGGILHHKEERLSLELFELKEIPHGHNDFGWGPTLVATVVSFLVGYAAIAWLLRYVSTNSYTPFVIYRILLGAGTLILLGTGVLTA